MDRRQKIIFAALKCFQEKGVAHTKLNEIAKLAKIPAPLIHYYYPEVQDLYLDVIQEVLKSLKTYATRHLEKISQDSGPRKTMENYIAGIFLWTFEEQEYFSLWLYFYYESTRDGPFRKLNDEIRNVGRERILGLFYEGLISQDFELPSGLSAKEAALVIQSRITGHAIMMGTESQKDSVKNLIPKNVAYVLLGFLKKTEKKA